MTLGFLMDWSSWSPTVIKSHQQNSTSYNLKTENPPMEKVGSRKHLRFCLINHLNDQTTAIICRQRDSFSWGGKINWVLWSKTKQTLSEFDKAGKAAENWAWRLHVETNICCTGNSCEDTGDTCVKWDKLFFLKRTPSFPHRWRSSTHFSVRLHLDSS